MKRIVTLFTVTFAVLIHSITAPAASPNENYDVFIPIAKYIRQGDAEKLSAWFNKTLEISILSDDLTCSKNQAKQIMKAFFETYTPREFTITHKATHGNMKYAIGDLDAGGEKFEVTILVNLQKKNYLIKMLKIDKKTY